MGIFGTIGSLLLGVLMWSQLSGLSGFLIGLVIAGAGVLPPVFFVSLLYNYGDMITVSIEQAKALKRLEAERPKETPGTVKPETAQPELAQANLAVESEQETDSINEIEEEGIIPVEEHVVEGEKINQDLPLQAYEVDRVKRIAHFTRRSEEGVICPVCFKWQMPEDDKCFRCSLVSYMITKPRQDSLRSAPSCRALNKRAENDFSA